MSSNEELYKQKLLNNEFLEENTDCEVKNMFGDSRYVLEEDDNGYLCIHLMQEGAYC